MASAPGIHRRRRQAIPETTTPSARNRMTPLRFILVFGVVSGLGDVVYEGARSMTGPFLAELGAGAALVGLITGAGEAVALVLRLPFGLLSDRTGRPWPITIAGYAITMVSVPLLAVSQTLLPAAALTVTERFGKAVRTPARDTMLAQASTDMGRGRAFAIHEALDQSGALVGPLLVAAVIAISGSLRWGFAVLAVPGAAAMAVLAWLRLHVPVPAAYEKGPMPHAGAPRFALGALPTRFWLYAGYATLNMLGFATWAVLAFHLQQRHVVALSTIPIMYAVAMGAAALGALASGSVYDRVGLAGLAVVPPLTAVVPFLSFSTAVGLVWAGAVVWGFGLGVHESTMRAAVADLVPATRRGAGFGLFTAIYGLAWLVGSTAVGACYARSVGTAEAFVVGTQVIAMGAFAALMSVRR
ncbi:MAG: MFS transporter [Solirubrobacteraceae bacterium]